MLPPYSYVPGKFPHPLRDPRGHSYGRHADPPARPEPGDWSDCREYLQGIELFNHGYYWEAHEVWEAVWIAAGRRGVVADFFKGLIKLAAAGVKAREGRPVGVRRHARRGEELFEAVRGARGGRTRWFGLDLPQLIEHARCLTEQPEAVVDSSDRQVVVVMPFRLEPRES